MKAKYTLLFLFIAAVSIPPLLCYAEANKNIPDKTKTIHIVQPHENLWSIAASHYPQEDTRKVVWEIEQLNHIDNVIHVGQEIVLP